MQLRFLISLLVAATATSFVDAETLDTSPSGIKVVRAFPNLRPRRPVVITHAGDSSNRLFLVTQQGVIHSIPNKQDVSETNQFLDIEDKVSYHDRRNEEGLLGLAFHPNYKENGKLYVYYSAREPKQTSIISEFKVSADDPNKADPSSEKELMRISQPFWNHNGGTIKFGPDGYLYVGLGDGGKANDPFMNGQNVQTLLGSILRIDVDNPSKGKKYGIPKDNPLVGKADFVRPEIYAWGFRNIWRFSFDRKTGHLWAADVGQNLWEEINIVQKGGNYGWNLREGNHKFGPTGSGQTEKLIDPIFEYDHEVGKSITGGYVYRGKKVPQLEGHYIYADYVSQKFWALKYDEQNKKVLANRTISTDKDIPAMTFGEDESGELYCSDGFGRIFWFEAE